MRNKSLGIVALTMLACSNSPSAPQTEATSASSASFQKGHGGSGDAILPRLPMYQALTVPDNGDINPYGVAFVPAGFPQGGTINARDILVANFNNSGNLQGTGTTLVNAKRRGPPVVFYSDTSAPGFSTALGVLRHGFVLLGNTPSADGSGACQGNQDNVGPGSLMILDKSGTLVQRLTSTTLLNGVWDLTVFETRRHAHVFVSLANTGTVTRIDLRLEDGQAPIVEGETQIASGYTHRCDPAAFVVGPTGLAYDSRADVLYVASTGDNAIFAVPNAQFTRRDHGTGSLVVSDSTHFHGPLGLARAQNGDLISSQGDAINPDPNQVSEIVEVTGSGAFVDQFSIDPAVGAAFGLALEETGDDFRFAAVDDGVNRLDVWTLGNDER